MKNERVIFVAVSVLIIVSIYISSTTFPVFVEARKTVINIDCWPQDGGKTRCCGSEVDDTSIYGFGTATYCTTCDDTQPPSNCTPREKIANARNSPSDVLNSDLELKGDETTDDTRIPKDFGRLQDNVITKDSEIATEDNQDTTNEENSKTPPPCPLQGPIPPNCTMKPPIEDTMKPPIEENSK
jgi:hypothetical protein